MEMLKDPAESEKKIKEMFSVKEEPASLRHSHVTGITQPAPPPWEASSSPINTC